MERTNFTRKFVEGVGWVVEEQPVSKQLPEGSHPVAFNPPPPPLPVLLETISYELAVQVVKNSGMFVVPLEFLTEEAKEEMLREDLEEFNDQTNAAADANKPMTAEDKIRLIKQAKTLDELADIVDTDTRVTVIRAAEARAAELENGE